MPKKRTPVSGDESEDQVPLKKLKKEPVKKAAKVKSTKSINSGLEVNEEGDKFISLGGKRRVTIREYKGATLIDVREIYEDKLGVTRPGSKGISLNLEQWNLIKKNSHLIDQALEELGAEEED